MGLQDCLFENCASTLFGGRSVVGMHRIPLPLKVFYQAFYPAGRQGIKGVGREPAIVGDLVSSFIHFSHMAHRSVQAGAQHSQSSKAKG